MAVSESEILVFGVGSSLLGDERVSIRAAHLIRRRLPSSVRVLALAGVGSDTIDELDGVSHILVLDCIDVGRSPGTIVCFEAGDLSPCAARTVFRFGVADLLVRIGQTSRAPEEAIVLGVQPASLQQGAVRSPEVEAAVPELVDRAVAIVEAWLDGEVPRIERSAAEPCIGAVATAPA